MATRSIRAAAMLGFSAGMRSMAPLAAVDVAFSDRRRWSLPAVLGAAAELVYDKLERAGERTAPAPLLARAGSAALASASVARSLRESVVVAAATGAVAAVAGTFLFHRLRAVASARLSPKIAAVGEDLLAAVLSSAAVRVDGSASRWHRRHVRW